LHTFTLLHSYPVKGLANQFSSEYLTIYLTCRELQNYICTQTAWLISLLIHINTYAHFCPWNDYLTSILQPYFWQIVFYIHFFYALQRDGKNKTKFFAVLFLASRKNKIYKSSFMLILSQKTLYLCKYSIFTAHYINI